MTYYLAIAVFAFVLLWPITVMLAQRRLSLGGAAGLAAVLALIWPLSLVVGLALVPHRRRR